MTNIALCLTAVVLVDNFLIASSPLANVCEEQIGRAFFNVWDGMEPFLKKGGAGGVGVPIRKIAWGVFVIQVKNRGHLPAH